MQGKMLPLSRRGLAFTSSQKGHCCMPSFPDILATRPPAGKPCSMQRECLRASALYFNLQLTTAPPLAAPLKSFAVRS